MQPRENKILIADDSVFMRKQIQKELISLGFHEIIFARNGKEAVDLFLKEKPSFILMDVKMPELDGIEATRQIITDDPSATIVIYSAEENQNTLMSGINEGAREFLIKPINAEKLKLIMGRFSRLLPGPSTPLEEKVG